MFKNQKATSKNFLAECCSCVFNHGICFKDANDKAKVRIGDGLSHLEYVNCGGRDLF